MDYLNELRKQIEADSIDKLIQIDKAELLVKSYNFTEFVECVNAINSEIDALQSLYELYNRANKEAGYLLNARSSLKMDNTKVLHFITFCNDELDKRKIRSSMLSKDRDFLQSICVHIKDHLNKECKICKMYM
jgi:hypothetical protein